MSLSRAKVKTSVLSCVFSAIIAALLTFLISPSHSDFAILWAAPRLAHPYDPEAIRLAISTMAKQFNPFVYPPNAMLLFAPFSLLPVSIALLLWTAIGGGLLGLTTRWAPALLFTPAVIWALPGQTSLILGSLIFLAFRCSERPMLSGVLFGIALVLKPQLAFVAPLAFVFKDWRVSAYAFSTFLVTVIGSMAVYGPHLWIDWRASLTPFLALHSSSGMLLNSEIAHGLPLWLKCCVALLGIALVAVERDKLVAFTLAVCTALIASPHAMGYEFAMLAPAVIGLVRRPGPAGLAIVAVMVTPAVIWTYPPILALMPRLMAIVVLAICVAPTSLARTMIGRSRILTTRDRQAAASTR